MKRYIFLLFFFLSGTYLYAQEKAKLRLADNYFENYDYSEAAQIYEGLAKKKPSNIHYVSRTAQCYRFTGNVQKAEEWYAKLANMEDADPLYILHYAEMLDQNKKYGEAKKYYTKYKDKRPQDSRAANKLGTVEQLPLFYKDSSFYRVTSLSINSENSDFGFFPFGGERFLFASNRENTIDIKNVYNWNKQPYLGLFRINRNTDGSFDPVQPAWDEMNSLYNEGPIFYDPSNSIFYITGNRYDKKKSPTGKDGVNKLKLSVAHFDGSAINGIFDFDYNSTEYSVGHAAISRDGQRLYFVSDMPGGVGGTDIYVCTKEGGIWGKPKNVGKRINTEGNEMFPFFSEDNKLYFSSDGYAGLGGLDIYSSETENDEFKTPMNAGYPINSNKDDFSFYISADNKNGFFSSNRAGGKGDDDIYSFALVKPLKVEVQGIVKNEDNESPVMDAKVVLQSFDGKPVEKITDSEGKFYFEANWDMDYFLTVSKEKYITTKKPVLTSESDAIVKVEVKIKRSDFNLDAKVVNRENRIPVSGATATIINSNKEAQTVQSDANGGFLFSLESANIYEIKIEKSRFITNTFVVSTLDMSPGIIRKTFSLEELKAGNTFEIKNVAYDIVKSNIQEEAKPELDKIVAMMKDVPTLEIELASHTDSRGDDETNMFLSDKCAKAAVAYIVSKGIAQRRVVGVGYGETRPVNRCKNGVKCSEEEFQMNRRTVITVLKI